MSSGQTMIADAGDPQSLKNLSLQQLSEIKVTTVSREPERALNTPAAVYVITGDDIRRSGVTSIPEALRLAPGVEVARIDSNKWSVGIRGFASRLSRSVLVLIDGRTVYTTLLAGTYWEVQDVVLEDVDRIEVIRGPGGTIWGPNAVNGVINIITKRSSDTQGVLFSAGAGNIDQGFANFRYGGKAGDNFTYRVYGKWFTRNHEFHPNHRNYDDWRAEQGGFRADWKSGDRDSYTVQGDLYANRAGEHVTATSYTAPFSTVPEANARLSGGNILARWMRTYSSGSDIQVQAYYDRTNREEPNFGDLRNTFDIDYVQHYKTQWRNNFTWGLGTRFSHGENTQVVSGLTFQPSSRTDRLLTAFVQDEIGLVENRLSLTLGSKFLNTNFTKFAPEPSARLMWTPRNGTSIWAAATHAVRTPSDAERDFFLSGFIGVDQQSGMPFFARFNANRNFRPEQMNGYELGFRQMLGRTFFVDIASYYNHYHNLFSEDIAGAPFVEDSPGVPHILLPAQFGNGLLGNTKGIEVSPEFRPSSWWRLRGTYSYLRMNLEKAPGSMDFGSIPGIVGASPNHQATITSSWDLPKRFSLDLTYRYVSSLPAFSIRSYSTGDVRFGWNLTDNLAFDLVGQNLFQPYHYESASDPGPNVGIKRSGFVKVAWTR